MKQTFTISFRNGCPIINDGEHNFLLDLGCPISFAASDSDLLIGGTIIHLNHNAMIADVQDVLGNDVHGLIGTGLLNGHKILIDYKEKIFIFDDNSVLTASHGKYYAGHYLTILSVNGARRNMYIDTGAHISYLAPELIPHSETEYEIDDRGFMGKIHARANTCNVELLGKQWTMPFAEAPETYRALSAFGINGMIGKDLFERFIVQIDTNGNVQFTAYDVN